MTDQLSMEQRLAIANSANRTAAKIEGDVRDGTISDPFEVMANQARRTAAAGWRIFATEIMAPVSFSFGQFVVKPGTTVEVILTGGGGGPNDLVGHGGGGAYQRPETPREFITAAVAAFRDYEQQHLTKDPPAPEKAARNAAMAERGEAVLASWEGERD